MIRKLFLYIIFLLVIVFSYAEEIVKDEYKLRRGDIISIEVLEHNELSKTITILPDGTIEYPILGNMKVIGMTASQLGEIIKNHLTAYINIPVVTVYVKKIYGNQINIIGYVNQPGSYQIYEPIDIPKALALAGGIENIRKIKLIKILKQDGSLINVKLDLIWKNDKKGIKNREKLLIYPGDTLIVPPPKEFNWTILSTFVSALSFLLTVYTVFMK